jgi:hypothetical protein
MNAPCIPASSPEALQAHFLQILPRIETHALIRPDDGRPTGDPLPITSAGRDQWRQKAR